MAQRLPNEVFTPAEQHILVRHFTNTDKPIFAIFNLPEIVKGALFARYSRSNKSLRRLFLDEFYKPNQANTTDTNTVTDEDSGLERAQNLYERVLNEYGDDSVAQLGAAHLACENVSNVLTKVLERGRLASYLEQSTRYINYGNKWHGSYRYMVPPELHNTDLEGHYVLMMDGLFGVYNQIVDSCIPYFAKRYPRQQHSERAWKISIQAQAYDVARGVLPASTFSNVGVFASGQALERLLLRLKASPLAEARQCAEAALIELRKVVPDFLKRIDISDRGGAWIEYLQQSKQNARTVAHEYMHDVAVTFDDVDCPSVELVKWDKDGERYIVAAILYENSEFSLKMAFERAKTLTPDACSAIIQNYCAGRRNRRHMPGRAFESTNYHFDILADYGSFRDLQRHRIMTIEWQPLTTNHGYTAPSVLDDTDLSAVRLQWNEAMERSAEFYDVVRSQIGMLQAQYVVPLAYNIRYAIELNARQAFHLIELRSSEQGHENYRSIVLEMYNLIRNKAQHSAVADAMQFVNTSKSGLARLNATENSKESKK